MHATIKSRPEKLHLLGISHNDVRLENIHVSESGKILRLILDYRTVQIMRNVKGLILNLLILYLKYMVLVKMIVKKVKKFMMKVTSMANMKVIEIPTMKKFLTR